MDTFRALWRCVDLLLLDMDGTLLDLRYDNEFWFQYLPAHYGKLHGMETGAARAHLLQRSERVRGTLDFYSMDYWTDLLGFDVAELNAELKELIRFLPGVPEFLRAWRAQDKKAILVTNSHPHGLDFKLRHTGLGELLDAVYNSHDLGHPKEDPAFWTSLAQVEPFEPRNSLLIDDNLTVLRSARTYGIPHLLASVRPDSGGLRLDPEEFQELESFQHLLNAMPGA